MDASITCDDDAFFDETWHFECTTKGVVEKVQVEFLLDGSSAGLMGLNDGEVWSGEAFETTVGAGCADEVDFLFRAEGDGIIDELTIRP